MVSCWDKWGYEDECWMKKPKTIIPPVSLRSSFLLPLLYLHLVPSGATWDLVLKVRKSKSIYTCVQPIHWFWPYLLNCLFMTVTQWLFHDSYNVHKNVKVLLIWGINVSKTWRERGSFRTLASSQGDFALSICQKCLFMLPWDVTCITFPVLDHVQIT